MFRSHVLICGGPECHKAGGANLVEALNRELEAKKLTEEIRVGTTGCFGLCALGPVMVIYPEGCFYVKDRKSVV